VKRRELLRWLTAARLFEAKRVKEFSMISRSKTALIAAVWVVTLNSLLVLGAEPVRLFDGKSFAGWDGDTNRTWQVRSGALVGGSLKDTVPRNEFLASTQSYTNFVLRLKFKLVGTEGFVNAGVQIRSQRVPNDSEMIGYQADIGAGWFGAIYDESRRNQVLAKPAEADVKKAVKVGDWNDYEIRAEGRRVVLKINGIQMVDYTEADAAIPQFGRLGLQVHGGGKSEISYRDLTLEVLP
jgi:hypothetical protein